MVFVLTMNAGDNRSNRSFIEVMTTARADPGACAPPEGRTSPTRRLSNPDSFASTGPH
jgi:hypothetical protein